ncbi:urease accessory protein UreF [Methylobacterium planeticum]|uniref:Urease accessory protein UreF n=1 Tax=Methylobacterium planeticum TaxID=2615211 RepID=A0A6N6MDW4_9HYPH|nr:urease accessory UreF family protein [Methylobacterium planeticum]KAB1067920.1 urease accessory protein UreF [Methylobacterium planeticum]
MLTRLLSFQQADAAFPSGSFAFSNGIEGLIAGDPAFDAAALVRTLTGIIRFRWADCDRVALILAHRAGTDPIRLGRIDAAIEAASLVEPMRLGSRRNGTSLLTAHVRLATPGAETLREAIGAGVMLGHLATVQGALWRALGLSDREAAAIAGYQLVSGLISASVRLGQIGAIEGQRALQAVLPLVAETLEQPVPQDPTGAVVLTGFTPMIEIAAMRHARADLRLFAN